MTRQLANDLAIVGLTLAVAAPLAYGLFCLAFAKLWKGK